MSKTNSFVALVFLFLYLVAAFANVSYAATIGVSPGGSIQDAIDGAAPGDTIAVSAGAYAEAVVLKDGITLTGSDLPTIGSSSIGGLSAASNCLISGFKIYGLDIINKNNVTIRNNIILVSDPDPSADITAVFLDNALNASIINNVIESDSGNVGVGVYLANMTGASAIIENNIILATTYSLDGDSTDVAISYNDLPEGLNHVGAGISLGPNNLSVGPDFIDSISFRIKPSSPCVDAGIITGGEITDIGVHTDSSAALQADFIASVTSGTAPLTVNFSDASTGTITSYLWDFGDPASGNENTSTDQNPAHIYDATGAYTVTFVVTGPAGSDTEIKTNYITVSSPPPPVADFTADATTGTEPLTVNFTDLSTGTITGWSWNFGDGGASTAQDPAYVYNFQGTYTVSLAVSGPGGSDTCARLDYITITPPDSDGDGIPDSDDNYPDVWPVRIETQYYTTLQAAYDQATEGDTIQSQHQLLTGDFILNRNISVFLEAGYNGDYSDPFGTTELEGDMRIINGTLRVTAGTLRIKQ